MRLPALVCCWTLTPHAGFVACKIQCARLEQQIKALAAGRGVPADAALKHAPSDGSDSHSYSGSSYSGSSRSRSRSRSRSSGSSRSRSHSSYSSRSRSRSRSTDGSGSRTGGGKRGKRKAGKRSGRNSTPRRARKTVIQYRSPMYRTAIETSKDPNAGTTVGKNGQRSRVVVSNFSRAARFKDEKTWVPGPGMYVSHHSTFHPTMVDRQSVDSKGRRRKGRKEVAPPPPPSVSGSPKTKKTVRVRVPPVMLASAIHSLCPTLSSTPHLHERRSCVRS